MSPVTRPPQLIEAPPSNDSRAYDTLGYVEAYDAILQDDYAFVAFRETDRSTGTHLVRIASKGTAGATFHPAAMRDRCREAAAKGETYFTWGYSFTPTVGDPRQIEFRVYQTDGVPAALEIFVVARKADGSAQSPKSVRVENFMVERRDQPGPLIEVPVSNASHNYKTLGYIEGYDAVQNGDYAFVAYQEIEKDSGYWRVCIKSNQTAGGSFDPAAIRTKARETGARGRSYFTWGYHLEPTAADPRQIEFRVYVTNGLPREVEIFLRLRKADHGADRASSVRFLWPQEP